ncbi:thiamine-phosphate pyrophosphorylase [Micromonospora violae]|uniref:Thiamine-phosphate pyrophosphorylase n=1 Tax=Micromonospora violae TaxID=1278207 RepID=A0A4Q7UIJ1_9ACTN|nr:thiamine-phosphate pyrophosphorylase [Micromonospora violae]
MAGAVAGGVRWVVLREKDLPRAERAAVAADLRAILADVDGTLIVAGPDPLGGDAVHLPAAGPYPPPTHPLVGRSCHDHTELTRLTTEHYATISPIWPTRTKPGYGPPLGIAGLGSLVRTSQVPVLALGGVETPEQVTACVQAGATGVAVLGALMRAEDPTETAASLTSAYAKAVTPKLVKAGAESARSPRSGLRPTVPMQGSSLTARSGHGRPQPPTGTRNGPPQPPTGTRNGPPQPPTATRNGPPQPPTATKGDGK